MARWTNMLFQFYRLRGRHCLLPCRPCSLCGSRSSKYTHPERFSAQVYEFLCKLEEKNIEKTACICYACHKQIKRNINNDSFKPRWRKLESKESKRCGIADCKAIASKVTQMATTEEIEYTLDQKVVSFTIDGMGAEEVRQRHVRRSFLLNQ